MIFKYLLIIQFELFKCAFVAEVDKHTHTGEKNIALLQDWPINFKRLLIIQFELIQCAMTRQIVKTNPFRMKDFGYFPKIAILVSNVCYWAKNFSVRMVY